MIQGCLDMQIDGGAASELFEDYEIFTQGYENQLHTSSEGAAFEIHVPRLNSRCVLFVRYTPGLAALIDVSNTFQITTIFVRQLAQNRCFSFFKTRCSICAQMLWMI